MQQNILKVIRKKKRLWNTYQKSKEYEEYLAYKRVEKEVKSVVLQAKKKFEKKLAKEAKKKPEQFYAYLKSKTSNKQSIGPLKDGDQVVSDNTGMANLLNQFFGSVFTNENTDIPDEPTYNIKSHLSDVQFGANNVLGKIHGLRQAPDKIST